MAIGTEAGYLAPSVDGSYKPDHYAPDVLFDFLDVTVLTRIMGNKYEGMLRKYGDTVKVRRNPDFSVGTYTLGKTYTYPNLQAKASIDLVVDKAKDFEFGVENLDQLRSDIKGFTNSWKTVLVDKVKIAIETEVFANTAAGVNATNKGLTAGALTARFNLGTIAAPLHLTGEKTYTDAVSGVKYWNAVNKLTDAMTVMSEAKIPKAMKRWAIVPPFVLNSIAQSDIKNADQTGDAEAVMRKGPDFVGKVAGFELYESTTLTPSLVGGDDGDLTVYPIIFGVSDAWTMAAQMEEIKSFDLQTRSAMGMRGIFVYGWKILRDTGLGVMYVTGADKN
jgi:hypothetical protein